MRAKKAKVLRKIARGMATNGGGLVKRKDGSLYWPEGSFRRIYQDLKRDEKR